MRTPIIALLFAALASACASERPVLIPPLERAPNGLAHLPVRIDTHLDVSGYWSRKGLGQKLVQALNAELGGALEKAGFRLGNADAALVARISAKLAGSTKSLDSKTVLEILHRGRLLGRFEVASPMAEGTLSAEAYPEYVSVVLVNALSHSPELLATSRAPLELPPILHTEEPAPPPLPVLAVFNVVDASGGLDEQAGRQLGDYLAIRVTEVLGLRVVPPAELRARLGSAKNESYKECIEAACQIELGKALAAQKILSAKWIQMGDRCVLAGTIYDLKSETAERAESVRTGCKKESLLDAADRLVEALANKGALTPKAPI